MNLKATVRCILFEAALGLWLFAVPLNAAQLNDVRVGVYDTFTRVVFEFNGPIQFQKPRLLEQGEFDVTFLNANSALTPAALKAKTKGLTNLTLTPQASHLVAKVKLPFTRLTLKTFALSGPERVVVDAYETKPPPASIKIKDMVVKESAQAGKPAPSTVQPQANTSAAAKGDAAKPAPTAAPASNSNTAALKPSPKATAEKPPVTLSRTQPRPLPKLRQVKTAQQPVKKRKAPFLTQQRKQYLITALIVIGCAVILLVGVLLLQRKRRPKGAKHQQTEDILQTTDDVLAAIDAKIKEKIQKYD